MTFIYVMPMQDDENGFVNGNVNGNGVPPTNQQDNQSAPPDQETEEPAKPSACSRLFGSCCGKMCGCCKKAPKEDMEPKADKMQDTEDEEGTKKKSGCFSCCKRKPKEGDEPIVEVEPEEKPPGCWKKMKCKNCCKGCCKRNKVADTREKTPGCFDKMKKKKKNEDNWAERRDSIMSNGDAKPGCCSCWKKLFCCCSCCKSKPKESRKTSMMSQKKSMSSSMAPPVEDNRPKLDLSLVEHTSHMRGAIPVLPVPIAWICLFLNVFLPGAGTIVSGLICLCIGKPRFSPRDGAKQRIGAFIIDVIVGFSQLFCVLFCLVGWGWSIWWGVIMVKVARKYKKLKKAEKLAAENEEPSGTGKDVEKGT